MTTGPLDPRFDPDRFDPDRDDPDRDDPGRQARLDPALDPDRYRADQAPPETLRGLDPRYDPDRFQDMTLPDLIGKDGAFEDERDNVQWLFGLLAVLAFLALVAFLFGQVLSP